MKVHFTLSHIIFILIKAPKEASLILFKIFLIEHDIQFFSEAIFE